MNKKLIFIFSFLVFQLIGCNDDRLILFTGFEPMPKTSAIHFDTISISPKILYRKDFGGGADSNFYWITYLLNSEYNIIHHCSSYAALTTDGDAADSLSINNRVFSISDFFKGEICQFRILNILKFNFESHDYLLLMGIDMLQNGTIIRDNTIFLVKFDRGYPLLICPPFITGTTNTYSYEPYYINDFNDDKYLDFLQYSGDTIFLYSLINDQFIRQKEFITTVIKGNQVNTRYMNPQKSNWPYPFFKSDSLHPDLGYALDKLRFDLKGSYYFE